MMRLSLLANSFLGCLMVGGEVLLGGELIPGDLVFNGLRHEWVVGSYFVDGDHVIFEGAGDVEIVGEVRPGSMVVRGGGDSVLSGLGSIMGDVQVVKQGSGTLKMNATNGYTGGTLIEAGVVEAGGTQSFGSGDIVVTSGVLDLKHQGVTNVVRMQGGCFDGADVFAGKLCVEADMSVSSMMTARDVDVAEGCELRISKGASLQSPIAEHRMTMVLSERSKVVLEGAYVGDLEMESTSVLETRAAGVALPEGCVWHMKGGMVKGNLTTSAGSTLKVSAAASVSGTLTLSGGVLQLVGGTSQVSASTVVLYSPTQLQLEEALEAGKSRTVLTCNQLLSESGVTYEEFFGLDEQQYDVVYENKQVKVSAIEPTPEPSPEPTPEPTPKPPLDDEEEEDVTDEPNDDTPPGESERPGQDLTNDDDPHEAGDKPLPNDDDPHNVHDENNDGGESSNEQGGEVVAESMAPALRQAGILSSWGAYYASDVFMRTMENQHRSTGASAGYESRENASDAHWLTLMGLSASVDSSSARLGADYSQMGLAMGMDLGSDADTRFGVAGGVMYGTVTADSFGELDQFSVHGGVYASHDFLPMGSKNKLNAYLGMGVSRCMTDPGVASGLDMWNYDALRVDGRLTYGRRIGEHLEWTIHGGVDYYVSRSVNMGDERVSGIRNMSGGIGSGLRYRKGAVALYVEGAVQYDMLRDDPQSMREGVVYECASPNRAGFELQAGIILSPKKRQWAVNLHYSFNTRQDASAHVMSLGYMSQF